jgi:hypothetical protein
MWNNLWRSDFQYKGLMCYVFLLSPPGEFLNNTLNKPLPLPPQFFIVYRAGLFFHTIWQWTIAVVYVSTDLGNLYKSWLESIYSLKEGERIMKMSN